MKKIDHPLLILATILIIGCGGGSGSTSTHLPKIGYWEIQDTTTQATLYKGFSNPTVLMLDQNNLSWSATFSSSYTSTSNSITDLVYAFIAFMPKDASQSSSTPEFSMNSIGTESSNITLYGKSVKLIFDPKGIHNSRTITPNKFANLTWTDQRDNHNTFTTTNTTFTMISNLVALAGGECTFKGRLPTTTVNYASVQVDYSCTTGVVGKTYLSMTTNIDATELIVGIEEDSNLMPAVSLFR